MNSGKYFSQDTWNSGYGTVNRDTAQTLVYEFKNMKPPKQKCSDYERNICFTWSRT
jgi:hypothetical protein